MSRELIVRIRDDFDGHVLDEADAETVPFTYRGVPYEIDLGPANVEMFDKTMEQFIKAARRAPKAEKKQQRAGVAPMGVGKAPLPLSRTPVAGRAGLEQRRRIRAWAVENGFEVYARGILPYQVLDAYKEAHPDEEILPFGSGEFSEKEPLATRQQPGRDRKTEVATKERRNRIRKWANLNGYHVAATGIIPNEVYDAYDAEHPDDAAAAQLQFVADAAYQKANTKKVK